MICDYRLKVFYTVAIKGSFTAAAKELGITQPAVSNHISELEGAIGDILFYRSRRESVLTQKGRILFDYAEKILNLYRCADRELLPAKREDRRTPSSREAGKKPAPCSPTPPLTSPSPTRPRRTPTVLFLPPSLSAAQ